MNDGEVMMLGKRTKMIVKTRRYPLAIQSDSSESHLQALMAVFHSARNAGQCPCTPLQVSVVPCRMSRTGTPPEQLHRRPSVYAQATLSLVIVSKRR